jgi:hypothetical protein
MDRTVVTVDGYGVALGARRAFVERGLRTARHYAVHAGDVEAEQVVKFLRSHYIVGLPLPGDRIGVDDGAMPRRDVPHVFLVPVTSVDGLVLGDDDNGKAFAGPMRTGNVWASYYRSHQAIYWASEWQLSPLWQALILLHEGQHAYQHLAMHHPPRTRQAREKAAERLEFRVLMAIGGKPFQQLIDVLASNSPAENQRPATLTATLGVLDSVFGKPISFEDEATRATFVDTCLQLRRQDAIRTAKRSRAA